MQENAAPAKKHSTGTVRSFSPGNVLDWFSADSLKWEESCRFLARLLHPDGPHCRKCGQGFTDERRRERWFRFERIQCPACGSFCTAATGTIIHKSEFEQREIILLALGLELGLNDKAIAKLLACSTETVRIWRGKFKALGNAQETAQ